MSLVFDPSNIDTSYDRKFESNAGLTWLPWVGKQFSSLQNKVMLLGESTYNWAPQDELVSERISRSDHLRLLHQNHALNFKRKSKYVRNIERAIYNKKNPSSEEKSELWASVVYHNLVLRPMATLNHRPNHGDYLKGWNEAINLFIELSINEVIVYGLEKEKIRALVEVANSRDMSYEKNIVPTVGRFRPCVIELNTGKNKVKLIFVRHPSAFFSWKKWAGLLVQESSLCVKHV